MPARTIDDYHVCPYRALLTAMRAPSAASPVKKAIAGEDRVPELPGDIIVYSAGDQPVTASIYTGEHGWITVRGVPDLVAAWTRAPTSPVVVELSRTPILGPRSLRHVWGRALLYAAALQACTGQAHTPVIATTSRRTRYHVLIPPPLPGLVLRPLAAVLESLLSDKPLPARPGEHCVHCLHRHYCPHRS